MTTATPKLPQSGGSYTRDKKGDLKQVEGTVTGGVKAPAKAPTKDEKEAD